MTEMRKDRRAPASLKVKYKSATVDDFIEHFGTDVSRGGIFIKTKKPLEAGALLKFEFQLSDGSPVLHGVGRVAWRRLEQNARPDLPAGMGIKFFKLSDHSRVVVERIESRFTGNSSRYEQTDAAEFAPPLSGNPPAADSGAKQLPNNGKRAGGSGPLTVPPPPAVSSIPPALADVPKRPLVSSKPAQRAPNSGLPKGTLGSFFPDNTPRKSGSPGQRTRDASEFLASAFQAGAGPEVRAAARAQAEHARRDPESVDLARELFGDLGPAPEAAGPPTAPPPPAAAAAVQDSFQIATPVPAVELPRAAPPRSSRPSLADKIPSLEQLVEDAGKPEPPLPSRRPPASLKPEEPQALTLAISVPNDNNLDSGPPVSTGRSRVLLVAALGSTLVLGGLAAYIGMQRSGAAGGGGEPAKPAAASQQAEPAAEAPPVEPAPQPAAAEPTPQPAAAAPAQPTAAEAPVAGPPVPVIVQAKPRGAQVLVAGEVKGIAPQKLSLPSNVPIELSVRSPGFAAVTRSITPRAGMPPEVFELAPLSYELTVQTDPPGGTVSVAGKSAVSPAPIDLGHIQAAINVAVDKEGFLRSARPVKLDEFSERDGAMRAEITIKLNPLPVARRRAVPAAAARPVEPPAGEPPAPSEPAAPAPDISPPVMQVKPEAEAPQAAPEPPPQAAPTPAPEPAPPAASPTTP